MIFTFVTVVKDDFTRLTRTVSSLINQSCHFRIHHHIQLCDTDSGTLEYLYHLLRVAPDHYVLTFSVETDSGIYDAMNKSLAYARGAYICFLNCGDVLLSNHSVVHLSALLESEIILAKTPELPDLIVLSFGYKKRCSTWDICGYSSFRNAIASGYLVCQQSLLYLANYLKGKPFSLEYKLAGDYDHSVKIALSDAVVMDIPYALVDYEPGGLSELCALEAANEIQSIKEAYKTR